MPRPIGALLIAVATLVLSPTLASAKTYLEIDFTSQTATRITGYVAYNPNVSPADCKRTPNREVVQKILSGAPPPVPRDAKVKKWTCHASDPGYRTR